ncbi:MAG: cobalamin-independent methionine synthase II family protein [Ilumatobacteraceae bacterium]
MNERLADLPLLPTTLVGSWSQPRWLIDKDDLDSHLPVRVERHSLWRVDDGFLDEAHADATQVAVLEQVRVGFDIVTDGEVRRESYSNRFVNALEGIDHERPGERVDRTGALVPVPRVSGPLRRIAAVESDVVAVVRAVTERPIKITIPGPFTMTQQAQNDHYASEEELAMALADVVAAEIADLFAAGADIVQIDEPYLQARPEPAADYGVAAIDRAVAGAAGRTALHVCFGYGRHVADKPARYDFLAELDRSAVDEISVEAAQPRLDLAVLDELTSKRVELGVLDLHDPAPEPVATVVDRIHAALAHVPADRLVIAPDCGFKYFHRAEAIAKATSMIEAARIVRRELTGA